MTDDYMKSIIEALLFISEKPVMLDQIKEVLGTVGGAEIKKNIKVLMDEYAQNRRGMIVMEIAGGYQMLSSPTCVSYVRNFFKTRVKEKLSRPALEALAIVAYKQPVSRADIEVIRGVNSDGVIMHLLNKCLIKIVGRKDAPGRPYIYGTTKLFLEYFGLHSLEDLPKLEEFAEMISSKEAESTSVPSKGIFSPESVDVAQEQTLAERDSELEPTQETCSVPQDNYEGEEEEIQDTISGDDNEAPPEDASSLKQVMDEISKEDQSDDAVSEQDQDTDSTEAVDDEIVSEHTELKVSEKNGVIK